MTVRPEELVQLRDKLVADGEGFNVPEANTKHPLRVRMSEVRRSPQAVAYRKRYVEELGRPHKLLTEDRGKQGIQLLRHGRGNPDTGLCWNLNDLMGLRARQAEEYCEREADIYS